MTDIIEARTPAQARAAALLRRDCDCRPLTVAEMADRVQAARGAGIENATYESLIDCLTWAVPRDFLPSHHDGARLAARQIVRFLNSEPRGTTEAIDFADIYREWEERDNG